ncbi:CLUMA_CG008593, isoform A [Clunio marinus]|uniref:RNA helicase n=1 Tax=Clunio marinus TaxID=568069 RepID=A0A1J1I4J8_9DIPT|nr:CLUMA_CG008593, isoform A [Clunio marinus]
MDNSIFKSLTLGVTFKKRKLDKDPVKAKIEVFKEDSDPEIVDSSTSIKKKRKKLSEEYLRCKNLEETNKLCKKHHINVKGCVEKVKPVESFQELFDRFPLNLQLVDNIKNFKYETPTPVQMQVLPLFLEGKSLKVVAPTGSGKTLAFVAPLIQNLLDDRKLASDESNQIESIILVPTRELASQILSVTTRLCYETGIRAHIITSTNDDHMKNFHKKKTNILISTPLKLVHFIKSNAMKLNQVKWIIIDEVDKLFEESNHGFKEDLDQILAACSNEKRKFALFSATTNKEMTPFVHENLKEFATVNISPNIPTSSVEQELKYVGMESAKLLAVREIFREGVSPPVLIFVQSKDRAKQLFSELMFDGLNIDIIHSDRSQKEREEVYKKFREGRIWVLICTELMSRGIDFRDVMMVVNFDLPTSVYSYIHRVGRCGRGNKTGKAITFYTNDDKKGILRDIAKLVEKSGSHVEGFLLQLKKSTKKERLALLKKAPKRKNISNKIVVNKRKSKTWKKNLKKKINEDDD